MVTQRPTLHGGQIHITIVTPDKVDEAAKVIRVHEIHNETLCSVTSYLDGSPVGQGGEAGGIEGQHPYDTSEHAQEHQNEARSSAIGGTIVIEIHNETRLIENRYFTSKSSRAAEGTAVPAAEATKKRKASSSVKVKKGSSRKKAVAPPKKARLAIEAAKPPSASVAAAAAREARQLRRSAGSSSEASVVGGLP